MAGEMVIAMYRPKAGPKLEKNAKRLEALIDGHVDALRALGLVSERRPILMRSMEDGTFLEIFEWVDAAASAKAHEAPEVQKIWGEMMEVADFPPLADLEEATRRFPHFAPVD